MIYAQLDMNNICTGISQLSGEVQAPNMLQIEHYDITLMGKKYENGVWVELPPEPMPVPEPTEEEIVQAELLLNQLLMQEQLNSIDEVNAQILLNTMGGM